MPPWQTPLVGQIDFWVVGPTKSRHIPPKRHRLTLTLFLSETRTVLIGSSWWRVSPPPTLKDGHRQWPSGIEARLPALAPEPCFSRGFLYFLCHWRNARWPSTTRGESSVPDLPRHMRLHAHRAILRQGVRRARRLGSRELSPAKGSSCRRPLAQTRAGPSRGGARCYWARLTLGDHSVARRFVLIQ